jgi:Subtilase family
VTLPSSSHRTPNTLFFSSNSSFSFHSYRAFILLLVPFLYSTPLHSFLHSLLFLLLLLLLDTTGKDIDVFIIDTGMDTLHTEFTQRSNGPVRTVKNLYDSFAYDSDFPSDNNDDVGHGTHVAGTCVCAWRRGAGVGASGGVLVCVGVRLYSSSVTPSLHTHRHKQSHTRPLTIISHTHKLTPSCLRTLLSNTDSPTPSPTHYYLPPFRYNRRGQCGSVPRL